MIDDNMIPPAPSPSLTDADVVSYLAHIKTKGWDVYKSSDGKYYIDLTGTQKIFLCKLGENQWLVTTGMDPTPQWPVGSASNMMALQLLVEKELGTASPTSALLYANEPITNLSKIANFIGQSTILAMFDPYLTDRTLVILTSIVSLAGASVDVDVHFITATARTIPNKNGVAGLTKTVVDAWFKQMGVQGEVRHINYQGHQRRFILLGGGQTLILGMSLNNPFTNEHISIEHKPENQTFFDGEWAKATPL